MRSKYRVVYNKKAGKYKIQKKCFPFRWCDLGRHNKGVWRVVYYDDMVQVDAEFKNLSRRDDLKDKENWSPV